MARPKTKGDTFQPSYDTRRVQPLGGFMCVRVFDHNGRGRQLEATPDALRALVDEIRAADPHLADKVETELNGWGFELADLEDTGADQ